MKLGEGLTEGKWLLASSLRPVSRKATNPPIFLLLHRVRANLSLVVIIISSYGRSWEDVARVAVCSGLGNADGASSVDSVEPVGDTVVNMSDPVRIGGPRFPQLDDD